MTFTTKLINAGFTIDIENETATRGDFTIDFSGDVLATFTGPERFAYINGTAYDYTIATFTSLSAAIESADQGNY